MSPKCLLDTPVCHPVQKMPHFTDKSATFRQKVWDYFIANSFRLHHDGICGLFSGLDPIGELFFLNKYLRFLLETVQCSDENEP